MTDKSEEQIARDKEMVAKMQGAKGAMEAALRRVELLEHALRRCRDDLASTKQYISDKVYAYKVDGRSQETVHRVIDEKVSNATKALG